MPAYTLFKRCFLMLILTALPGLACAAPAYPPDIPGARTEVYKSADGVDLRLWIMEPARHKPGADAPAIIFFFGGGWNAGSPGQFQKQSEWLAARGMVAFMADYRVRSRHDVPARVCVADAKSALRYLRANAARLGIDPDRIVAAGGSAGGHLAASVALLPGHDDPSDDLSISAVPNALALFNPAVVLAPLEGVVDLTPEREKVLLGRHGADLESMSPYHHIRKGLPPAIIFHGTEDPTVPYKTVEAFQKAMTEFGNACRLVGYKGAGHGFFNWGRERNIHFIDTMARLDAFMVDLGYLPAPAVTTVLD